MHDKWQEQLSFYVAGSLPAEQTRALEQHLAGCAHCQQALAEWQMISTAVRAEASQWGSKLPPLSAEVRAALPRQRNGQQLSPPLPYTTAPMPSLPMPRIHQRARVPLTALAAMLTVVLMGGLIFFLSTREPERSATEVAMRPLATETRAAREATATEDALPTREPAQTDLGILSPPTIAPTSTILFTPSPQPPPATSFTPAPLGTPQLGIGGASAASNATLLTDVCTVTPLGGGIVMLYAHPDSQSQTVGTINPTQSLRTYVRSSNGWYQIVEIGPGILGWAPAALLALNGPCADLPLPTATMPRSVCTATVIGERVNLRLGPGDDFDYGDAVGQNEAIVVTAQSDNNWYRIEQNTGATLIFGWLPAPTIRLNAPCTDLPRLFASNFEPRVSATRTPAAITPMAVTSTFTPTPIRGQITRLDTSVTMASRGDTVSVYWETRDTTQVWLEVFGVDMQTGQSANVPFASMSFAPTSGEWAVTIPSDFNWSGARFVVIVDNYDNGMGIPRAEVVVRLNP